MSYFTTLLDEKGIDLDTPIVVKSLHNDTENHMTVRHVLDEIHRKKPDVQKILRKKLIMIDYRNGDVLDLFRYVARFMAINF